MPRNQEKNIQLKDRRKEQILEEARNQFAVKGLAATKITDISSCLGISQGLIYHYYASKEEIFVELIRDAFEKMSVAALNLEKMAIPPHEKIKEALYQLLDTIEHSEAFVRTCLLIAQATISTAIPKEAKNIILDLRDIPYQAVANIMAEGQKEGTIQNGSPAQMSMAFWAAVNGLAIYKATRGDGVSLPDAAILLNMFLQDQVEE